MLRAAAGATANRHLTLMRLFLSSQGVEATLFATLMSLLNSGTFVGSALGSALTAWLGVTSGGQTG